MNDRADCRERAEWCYRQAGQCADFLAVEILTAMGNDLMDKAQRLEKAPQWDRAA